MRLLLIFVFFILTKGSDTRPVYQIKSVITANEILQKLLDKLNTCQTISYNYYRSINYFSEGYHSETSGTTFLDFKSSDTTLGFKYQLENEQYKMVFNGAESFYLNKKGKTIKINYRPNLNDFASLSFFVNSIVTLKKSLPVLIAEREVVKALTDTIIGNKSFYLVYFILKNKTMNGLGTFTATTLKRDFLYKVVIDKEAFWPLHVIQTNDAEPKDYMLTSFSNITMNSNIPPELSWYHSTYTSEYKSASEKTVSLIKKNAVAPHWQLPYFTTTDSLSLNNLKGKVVLLEFWIKNCGYCIEAVPKLNTLIKKYNNKKFQVVGINAYDTREDIASFYKRNNPTFKTVNDNGKVTNDYGVEGFPTVVLIDKKGVVLYSGNYDQRQLDNLIKNALR
jgi:thiol-disulfide isomerase/thioredoxin